MATNISIPTYGFVNHILALNEGNWRTFFKPFITDSVQNGLATIAGTNMTVYVSAGECRCGAVMGILDEMIALDVANGDSTYNRIDSVVVQYTYGEPSTLAVAIVQGTPSANPVPPTLTKVYDTLWQMEIAQILVPSGATSSSEFTITDKRVIYESIESIIDDNTESEERVWSSQKTHEEIVSLSTEIYDSLNTKADAIERTTSGSLVHLTDAGAYPVDSLSVGIDPVQDLHGYDAPWPAGGGKNLLPITLVGLKSWNTQGTWSNNVYTLNDVTFTISTNTEGYVTKIVLNGTASAGAPLVITETTTHNDWLGCIMNGAPSGSSGSTSYIAGWNETDSTGIGVFDFGSGATIPNTLQDKRFRLYIGNPSGAVNSNRAFYPMIRLASETDATFAPYSNICPIIGHANAVVTRSGKNLLPNEITLSTTEKDVTFEPTADGGIYIHGTNSGNIWQTRICKDYSLKAGNYIISIGNNLPTNALVQIVNRAENYAYYSILSTETSKNFTVTKAMENDLRVRIATSGTVTFNNTIYPMIRLASETDDTFETYKGTSVTISLDGTRYGGTIDVLTGTLTVNEVLAPLTDIRTFTNGSAYLPRIVISQNAVDYGKAICSHFQNVSSSNILTKPGVLVRSVHIIVNLTGEMYATGAEATNAFSAFLTANPNFAVVYPLASPVTVTLDPATLSLLLGENNIWADTGDILNLTYRADTKTYIEQKVADTNCKTCEMMTIVTDKMIAPDNLIVGDLVIVNDDLYKVINSNIASGEAMVIGTNVIKITLAEYIQSML